MIGSFQGRARNSAERPYVRTLALWDSTPGTLAVGPLHCGFPRVLLCTDDGAEGLDGSGQSEERRHAQYVTQAWHGIERG